MKQLVTLDYEHHVPERTVAAIVPAETFTGQVSEEITLTDAELKQAHDEYVAAHPPEDDTVGGGMPTGDTRATFSIVRGEASKIMERWAAAIASQKEVVIDTADYPSSDTLVLPSSGFEIRGCGATRNHAGAIVGTVIRGNFNKEYSWHGETVRKPMFASAPNRMITGGHLYGLGIVCEDSNQDIMHLDGLGNGSKFGPYRLRGGNRQIWLRAPFSGEPGYIATIGDAQEGRSGLNTVFSDAYKRCFLETTGGNPGAKGHTQRGPTYVEVHGADVQTEVLASYHYIFNNAQEGANQILINGGIYHGRCQAMIRVNNCPNLKLTIVGANCLVGTLVECDHRSNVTFTVDPKGIVGLSPGEFIVKKLNENGSINAAQSLRR